MLSESLTINIKNKRGKNIGMNERKSKDFGGEDNHFSHHFHDTFNNLVKCHLEKLWIVNLLSTSIIIII